MHIPKNPETLVAKVGPEGMSVRQGAKVRAELARTAGPCVQLILRTLDTLRPWALLKPYLCARAPRCVRSWCARRGPACS